jgi:membrane fusion protein (multidrug efflux system)
MSETTQADRRVVENTPPAGGGTAAAPAAPAAPVAEGRRGPRKRHIALVLFLIAAVGASIFGVMYWLHARQFEETDDAVVDGAVTPISPKVAGLVSAVRVSDNQQVKAGDTLVEIDPSDYVARVNEAKANLAAAQSRLEAAQTNVDMVTANVGATLSQATATVDQQKAAVEQERAAVIAAEAQVASAHADVVAAQAESTRRKSDLERYNAIDPRAVSQQTRDAARAAAEAADAQLAAATKREAAAQAAVAEAKSRVTAAESKVTWAEAGVRAAQTGPQQVATAKSQVQTAQAAVDQAQAALAAAQLDLAYTTIKAPIAGRITRKSVQPGQYLSVGQNLFAIVPDDLWVTANFKETQLARMRPGQPAEITIDRYPGRTFKGHVDSIQAGTGARFSMLPPENATGNFVKIVQRVPVKIRFDESDLPPLGPGMSAVPTVRVRGEDGSDYVPASQPAVQSTASARSE